VLEVLDFVVVIASQADRQIAAVGGEANQERREEAKQHPLLSAADTDVE